MNSETLFMVGSVALFILSIGLLQEVCRIGLVKKRENGEDVSWGFLPSILIVIPCVIPQLAIIVIIFSISKLYLMGCDVRLCLFMPRELTTPLEKINKLKRLEQMAKHLKEKNDKIVQDLKNQKPEEPKK